MEGPRCLEAETAESEHAEGRVAGRLRRLFEVAWGTVEIVIFLCVALVCVPLWITRWACDRAVDLLWWIASLAGPGLRQFNDWRRTRREMKESFARMVDEATILKLDGKCRCPSCGRDEEEDEGEEQDSGGKAKLWGGVLRSARGGRRRRPKLRMLR